MFRADRRRFRGATVGQGSARRPVVRTLLPRGLGSREVPNMLCKQEVVGSIPIGSIATSPCISRAFASSGHWRPGRLYMFTLHVGAVQILIRLLAKPPIGSVFGLLSLDGRGRPVPEKKQRAVRDRTVQADQPWLRYVLRAEP